ncbi:Elongin-A, variant 2 [Basidiobolus ranarum]
MEHEHKKNLKFEQWSKKLKERYAQVHNQKKHTIYTEDVPPPPRGMSSGWASFGPRKTTRGFSIAAKARAETRHISSIYKSNTNPNSGYRRRKDTTIGNSFSNGSLRAKSESPLTSRYGSKPIIGRSPQGSSQSPPSEKILRKVHPDIKNIERKQCNEIKAPIFTQNASKLHTSESIFKNNPTSTPVTSKVFSSSWNSYQSSISEGNFKRAKTDTSVIRKIRSETRNQPYTPASSSRSPPYQSTPYNRSKTTTTRAYSPTYNSSTIKTKSPKSPSSSNQIGNNNGHTQEPGSNSWCSPEVDASFFAMLHGKKPPKKLRGNSD